MHGGADLNVAFGIDPQHVLDLQAARQTRPVDTGDEQRFRGGVGERPGRRTRRNQDAERLRVLQRLSAAGIKFTPNEGGQVSQLPSQILEPFSQAMSEAMLLCSGVMVIGLIAVLGFQQARHCVKSDDRG